MAVLAIFPLAVSEALAASRISEPCVTSALDFSCSNEICSRVCLPWQLPNDVRFLL